MIYIYVVFILVLLLYIKKRQEVKISLYLVGLYALGILAGVMLFTFYPQTIEYPNKITLVSVSFHCVCLFLLLHPLIHHSKKIRIERFVVPEKNLRLFSWLVVIPSILSIVVSSIDVLQIFAFGNFLNARNAFLSGEISNLYISRFGYLGYLFSFGPQISFIALVLFFYLYFVKKKSDTLTYLLLISSFSIPINNLAIAGREGLVRWFLYLGFCIFLFRNYLVYKRYKKLFRYFCIFSAIIIIFFASITMDRYGESDLGAGYSILRYIGEPYYYFSYHFDRFLYKGMSGVETLFPLFTQETRNVYNLNETVIADYSLNTFSTIAGSFVSSAGVAGAFSVCCGWFIIGNLLLHKERAVNVLSLGYFVLYIFMYEIVLLGVFYYLHGGRFTQISIAFYVILAYIIGNRSLKL